MKSVWKLIKDITNQTLCTGVKYQDLNKKGRHGVDCRDIMGSGLPTSLEGYGQEFASIVLCTPTAMVRSDAAGKKHLNAIHWILHMYVQHNV